VTLLTDKLVALAEREDERAVLFTVLEGDGAGTKLLVLENGELLGDGPAELAESADDVLRRGRNRLLELDDRRVFCEVYGQSTLQSRSAVPPSCSAGAPSSPTRAASSRRASAFRARTS
jgi:hypothetical protein